MFFKEKHQKILLGIENLRIPIFKSSNLINVEILLPGMLTPEEKEKLIKKYKLHEADTGSAQVQIALLTEEIKRLVLHLKKHPKDFHSKRGLLKMVDKRRKFLKHLKEEDIKRYNSIVKEIGLKK